MFLEVSGSDGDHDVSGSQVILMVMMMFLEDSVGATGANAAAQLSRFKRTRVR